MPTASRFLEKTCRNPIFTGIKMRAGLSKPLLKIHANPRSYFLPFIQSSKPAGFGLEMSFPVCGSL